MTHECPWCGPFKVNDKNKNGYLPVCPACEMDEAEHRYRLLIMADSAAVYAKEESEFRSSNKAN